MPREVSVVRPRVCVCVIKMVRKRERVCVFYRVSEKEKEKECVSEIRGERE